MKRIWKKMLCVGMTAVMMVGALSGCGKQDKELTTIRLNEVAHSIFYAPQYVAIEKGYFEDEGIALELTNGMGADNVMTAVVSGEADIGFMGSESSIYVYQEGAKDYIVNFAQLTNRAGNFLVAKTKDDSFDWSKLKGKTVLGGRDGGMPEMVFELLKILTLVSQHRHMLPDRETIPWNLNHLLLLWRLTRKVSLWHLLGKPAVMFLTRLILPKKVI